MKRTIAPRARRRSPALTLVEVVIAAAVLGGLLAATLSAVVGVAKARLALTESASGAWLAQSLLDEIASRPYVHPVYAPGDEPLIVYNQDGSVASRVAFDEVGDYANFTETPPRERDGTVLVAFTGWTRQAKVQTVSPTDLSVVGTDQGVKCVTVTVLHGLRQVAAVSQLRTSGTDGAHP